MRLAPLALAALLALPASAQSPVLDASYGDGGSVTEFYATPSYFLDRTHFGLLSDGSAYYVTSQAILTQGQYVAQVGRILPDGQGDASFGTDGSLVLSGLDGASYEPTDLLVDSNGEAAIVGTNRGWRGEEPLRAPFFVRVRPDGSVPDRRPIQRYDLDAPARGTAVAQAASTFYLGVDYDDGRCGVLAVRPNGSVRTTFGTDGIVELLGGAGCRVVDLETDPRGRVLVALDVPPPSPGLARTSVVRLTPRGLVDTGFGGGDGIYNPFPMSSDARLRALEVTPDGWIYTGGYLLADGDSRAFVALSNRNASNVRTDNGTIWRWFSEPLGVASPRDGAVLVADDLVVTASAPVYDAATNLWGVGIVRLKRNGSYDQTFGDGGYYLQPGVPESGGTPNYSSYRSNTFLDRTDGGRLLVGGSRITSFSSQDAPYLLGYLDGVGQTIAGGPTAGLEAPGLDVRVGPNPAVGAVTVRVQAEGPIRAEVFDALGRHVATLADGAVGGLEAHWTPPAGASGVYVVRVEADGETRTVPVTVVR